MTVFKKTGWVLSWGFWVAALWMAAPKTVLADKASISAEVQGSLGIDDPSEHPEDEVDLRGWVKIKHQSPLFRNGNFRFDIVMYMLDLNDGEERKFFDGEAALTLDYTNMEVSLGLLRESWGRLENSPLDVLGPANTIFSLVDPQLRLSQPTVKARIFAGKTTADVYALIGRRFQPVPDVDRRFGFSVPTENFVEDDKDQALAMRITSTISSLDWAVHVFSGSSPRPTFITRVTPTAGLVGVDAFYNEIFQYGGELETTIADWRFAIEGFSRSGAINALGEKQDYNYFASLGEYQLFGIRNGAYDIISRFEVTSDTRKDKADLPFASSVRVGVQMMDTDATPVQVQLAYLYDWLLEGYGATASIEQKIGSPEQVTLGLGVTFFSNGEKPSVLDIWEQDFEVSSFLRMEI